MRISTSLTGLLAAVALCACPGGGTVDTDGGTTGKDGGGTTGPTTTKTGNILITQSATKVLDMTYYGGFATASFSTTVVPAGTTSPCVVTTSGSCTATRCTPVDAGTGSDAGAGPTNTVDSAGVITIGGTLIDGGITLTPTGANYPTAIQMSRVWADGATLTAGAAGATVPAFSGKTVVTPGSITVTAPACTLTSCGTVNRANALPVTWTGGASGNVTVTLTTSSGGNTGIVVCTFAASAGTGSVPADALSKLDAVAQGYMAIGSSNATDFTSGDYAIKLHAVGPGAQGAVVVQ